MKSQLKYVFGMMSIFCCVGIASAESHEMPHVKTSPQLDKMKELVGTWKGAATDMEGGTVEVQYRLSSGGTAVVETIAPGSPHEMTTVYYDEGGKLAMTHYCMLGNHPVMKLTKDSAKELKFAADSAELKNEQHMHTLDIEFEGPNAISHRWAMFDHGKEAHVTTFDLKRES